MQQPDVYACGRLQPAHAASVAADDVADGGGRHDQLNIEIEGVDVRP